MCFGVVGGHAVDGEVVFGFFVGQEAGFGGFDGFQHGGVAVRVFVYADAEVDFLGAGFGFEGFAQSEDGVGGCGLDFVEEHVFSFLENGLERGCRAASVRPGGFLFFRRPLREEAVPAYAGMTFLKSV